MASRDLLRKPIFIEGKVLERMVFFCELQESMKQLRTEAHESVKSEFDVVQQGDLRVRSHVRLCRAAITTLANEKDFDTIDYILKLNCIQSREILALGKGLTLEEFSLLEVYAQTDEELEQEIKEIKKVQRKITKHATIKLDDYREQEKPKKIREKHKKAAFFQGTGGMAVFYHQHYDS